MTDKKIIAFIVKILLTIIYYGARGVSSNDIQSLENIAGEIGAWDLKDEEFRY